MFKGVLWSDDGFWPAMKRVIKMVYTASLMLGLGYAAYALWNVNLSWWESFLDTSWFNIGIIWLGGCLVMEVLGRMDVHLRSAGHPMWQWRPWGRNINFIPLDYAVLRVPFLVLLYLNLPILAYIEDVVFRAGCLVYPQVTLFDAVWRSIVFGFIHLIGGTRFGTCFAIVGGGLWFSVLYWYGDLPMATLGHLACNCIGLTGGLLKWTRTGTNPFTN